MSNERKFVEFAGKLVNIRQCLRLMFANEKSGSAVGKRVVQLLKGIGNAARLLLRIDALFGLNGQRDAKDLSHFRFA